MNRSILPTIPVGRGSVRYHLITSVLSHCSSEAYGATIVAVAAHINVVVAAHVNWGGTPAMKDTGRRLRVALAEARIREPRVLSVFAGRQGGDYMSSSWELAVLNAATAGVLINAGVAKMIVPGPLLRASADLPVALPGTGKVFVRGFGAIELGAAVALLFLSARLPATVAVAALGICFALAGLVGVLRGSSVPCGCFGGASRQPLGWVNVALGIALTAVWPMNALVGRVPAEGYSLRTALLASIASAVLCLWLNRRLIARVLPANRVPQPEVG